MNGRRRLRGAATAAALAVLCLAAATGSGPDWQLTQITTCSAGLSSEPRISADGSRILFLSSCDLAGDNNDHSVEIFEAFQGRVSQLTSGSFCQVYDLAPAPDGDRIAFLSNCPYRGKNQDQGIEIMLRDRRGEVSVLTRSRGARIEDLAWSSDGRYLYFSSAANYITAENMDGSREIFSIDAGASPPSLRQVTKTVSPRGCSSPAPVPGAVLALCDDDFKGTAPANAPSNLPTVVAGHKPGGNPDRNPELMSFSLEGQINQLTYTVGCKNTSLVTSANGRVTALVSECNLVDPKKPGNGAALYFYSGGRFSQLGGAFTPRDLALSRDGAVLAFCANLAADRQNRERNLEVFILRLNELKAGLPARGGFPPGFNLASDFPAGSARTPVISDDGRTVAFAANGNIDRRNQDGGFEIFVLEQQQVAPVAARDDDDEDGDTVEPDPDEPGEEDGDTLSDGDTVEPDEDEEKPEEEPEEPEEPLRPVEESDLPLDMILP